MTYDIVRLHSETERCSPYMYFSLIVRQYKWPSLSRKIVEMQKTPNHKLSYIKPRFADTGYLPCALYIFIVCLLQAVCIFDFDHSVFRLVYNPYQILEFWPPIKQVSLPRLFASVIAPWYLCISKECVGGIFFWQPALYGHLDNWIIQTVCQVPMSVLTTLVTAGALLRRGGGGGGGRKVHTCMFLVWISNRVVARLRSRPCPCWYLTHLKICRLLPFQLSYALF